MSTEVLAQDQLKFIAEARRLLALMQDPVWSVTEAKPDADHVVDHAVTLAKTREYFPRLPKSTVMNMVVGEGNRVFAFTGNSPDAADRAKALVGFLQAMPYLLTALELRINNDLTKTTEGHQ